MTTNLGTLSPHFEEVRGGVLYTEVSRPRLLCVVNTRFNCRRFHQQLQEEQKQQHGLVSSYGETARSRV